MIASWVGQLVDRGSDGKPLFAILEQKMGITWKCSPAVRIFYIN